MVFFVLLLTSQVEGCAMLQHSVYHTSNLMAVSYTHLDVYKRQALNAALMALERASMRAEDLDMVIFATSSPDYFVPASASLLQDRLGARKAGAFDLTSGCTGFLYGLVTASQFIRTGGCLLYTSRCV